MDSAVLLFHAPPGQRGLSLPEVTSLPVDRVSPADLRLALSERYDLRLVFLNSCWAGRVSQNERLAFADMSAGLVKNGLPAIISLRGQASQEAAIVVAAETYRALAQGYPLEEAVAESRRALYLAGRADPRLAGQWFLPVLYEASGLTTATGLFDRLRRTITGRDEG
jgi:hypothetical protein